MNTNLPLRRQAFIYNGHINEKTATLQRLINTFLELNSGNNRALTLYITSTGGYRDQAFAFGDLIRKVQEAGHEVTIHVLGQLCNFNILPALVADHFIMEPTASLTFSRMWFSAKGPLHELVQDIKDAKETYSKFVAAVAKYSKGKVDEATVRSWKAKHFTAQEALALGLCEAVLPMPEGPIEKTDQPEHVVEINGLFSSDDMYDRQIDLHIWLENKANAGRPIRVKLTSRGGTVVQAYSLYGQLCEAQRMGHHVTVEVIGKAYSCAMWFITLALKAGTVELNSDCDLMFHEVSVDPLECDLDDAEAELSIHQGVYRQTCSLLCMVEGITPELLKEWEALKADHYIPAAEAVSLGLGKLVSTNLQPQAEKPVEAPVDGQAVNADTRVVPTPVSGNVETQAVSH